MVKRPTHNRFIEGSIPSAPINFPDGETRAYKQIQSTENQTMNTIMNIILWLLIAILIWAAFSFFNEERKHVKKLREMKKESDKKDGRTHV